MTQTIDQEIKSQLKRWHYSAISLHSTYIAL